MTTTVIATYEDGILRLQNPLDLAIGQTVRVQVMEEVSTPETDLDAEFEKRRAAYERLIARTSDEPLPPWSEIKEMIEGRFDDKIVGR